MGASWTRSCHHRPSSQASGPDAAGPSSEKQDGPAADDAVRQALMLAWEAPDRICGKRLKAFLPVLLDAMNRYGRLAIDVPIRQSLSTMSAATIDRAMAETRVRRSGRYRPSNVRWRLEPSRTGTTRHPASWKPISWCTEGRSRGAAFCNLWC